MKDVTLPVLVLAVLSGVLKINAVGLLEFCAQSLESTRRQMLESSQQNITESLSVSLILPFSCPPVQNSLLAINQELLEVPHRTAGNS